MLLNHLREIFLEWNPLDFKFTNEDFDMDDEYDYEINLIVQETNQFSSIDNLGEIIFSVFTVSCGKSFAKDMYSCNLIAKKIVDVINNISS